MKQSDLNHLRRLVAWVQCEIGQGPDELMATVRTVADKLGHPEISPEAKQRLVESHDKARQVPMYVREAVKALDCYARPPGNVVDEPKAVIPSPSKCWCLTCRPISLQEPGSMRMALCPECGNKRCPKANDHRHACTDSNEPGQPGSAYPVTPQDATKNVRCLSADQPIEDGYAEVAHHANVKASLAYVQRKTGFGYQKTERLLELALQRGDIGAYSGRKLDADPSKGSPLTDVLALRNTPEWEPQFDVMSPGQEALVMQFCLEIAGPRGQPGRPPDPVRLLEMAQALYEAERQDLCPMAKGDA